MVQIPPSGTGNSMEAKNIIDEDTIPR